VGIEVIEKAAALLVELAIASAGACQVIENAFFKRWGEDVLKAIAEGNVCFRSVDLERRREPIKPGDRVSGTL
jgi:hypothetical protein